MALVNHAKKEINAKIVYYGPANSGKSTALTYIYSRIKPSLRGEFKTVPAGADNLLFFDFSPFEAPIANGYRVRLHIYTLTGTVTNPATWKMTLKGADGIIIMINPALDHATENSNSVSQLRDFLSAYGVGLHDTPVILLLNSFAQETLTDENRAVSAAIDLPMVTTCQSNAARGEGLLESMTSLSRQILDKVLAMEERPETEVALDTTPPEIAAASSPNQLYSLQQDEDYTPVKPAQNIMLSQGIVSEDGTIRIPLEISVGETVQKLSIAIKIELQ